jgi:flagellar hook-associated protein 3 FlgL
MSSGSFLAVPELLQQRRMSTDNNLVKANLLRAQTELTTGLKQDRVSATNGDTSKLMALERAIGEVDARAANIAMAQTRAAATQTALSSIMSFTEKLPVQLWDENFGQAGTKVDLNGVEAETALKQVMDRLNTQVAGRGLFNGAVGAAPTFNAGAAPGPAENLIATIRTAIDAAPNVAAALTAVDEFFSNVTPIAGGTFDDFFAGDGTAPGVDLGDSKTTYAIRGDAQALKDVMKGLALAAALRGSNKEADAAFARTALAAAGDALATGRDGVTVEQARLGSIEARMEDALSRDAAEKTTLSITRMDLIGRDGFDAANEVQELENRLQMIYAITARTADLSFVNFFR